MELAIKPPAANNQARALAPAQNAGNELNSGASPTSLGSSLLRNFTKLASNYVAPILGELLTRKVGSIAAGAAVAGVASLALPTAVGSIAVGVLSYASVQALNKLVRLVNNQETPKPTSLADRCRLVLDGITACLQGVRAICQLRRAKAHEATQEKAETLEARREVALILWLSKTSAQQTGPGQQLVKQVEKGAKELFQAFRERAICEVLAKPIPLATVEHQITTFHKSLVKQLSKTIFLECQKLPPNQRPGFIAQRLGELRQEINNFRIVDTGQQNVGVTRHPGTSPTPAANGMELGPVGVRTQAATFAMPPDAKRRATTPQEAEYYKGFSWPNSEHRKTKPIVFSEHTVLPKDERELLKQIKDTGKPVFMGVWINTNATAIISDPSSGLVLEAPSGMRIHRNTLSGATVIEQGGVYWLSIRDCFSISPQSPNYDRHGASGRRPSPISMDIPFATAEQAVACLQLMDQDPGIATKLMSELAPELKQNGWIDSVGIVKRRESQDKSYRIAEPAGKA